MTGFEPATFSLGSFSSNQQEPLHSNESQELAGLEVRSLGSWPLLCDLLQDQKLGLGYGSEISEYPIAR